MKKMKNKKRTINRIAYGGVIFLLVYFGINVLIGIVVTPILTVFNAANSLYALNNDPSVFISASQFAQKWIISLVVFSLSLVAFKILRKKIW